MKLEGKRILVTGGTGSLGKKIVERLLTRELGRPSRVIVFSRDEAKQHYMRLSYQSRSNATDDVIYRDSQELLSFRIGDVRDYDALSKAVRECDAVFHAAALKQVPTCEYFPTEAVKTNILGAANLARAVQEAPKKPEVVVGISTNKACKPINVMGMTKALQERILIEANIHVEGTRFACVRYGNVLASRGSVVPLFLQQIADGGPVTITRRDMTRFFLSLDEAVDTVFAAVRSALPGETYVPKVAAANVIDMATALVGDRKIEIRVTGIRPGEKIHEVMVSEEECHRTFERDGYYVIAPILPELRKEAVVPALDGEYSSSVITLSTAELVPMLEPYARDFARGALT